ncbi:MAG: hypothetical protein ABI343_03515, partial [Burkholderiaceae bacterium]
SLTSVSLEETLVGLKIDKPSAARLNRLADATVAWEGPWSTFALCHRRKITTPHADNRAFTNIPRRNQTRSQFSGEQPKSAARTPRPGHLALLRLG